MDTSFQILFALLRASLFEKDIECSYFNNVSADDWKKCYRLSAEQGVMALAWDGVMKLPKDLQPPINIKISWAAGVEKYENTYERYCATVDEVSRFYAKNGISTIQLKGVGFSSLYPVPCHREGGDIDIYTYSANKDVITDKQANTLADNLMIEKNIEVCTEHPKHSNFYYNGIPFENHKTFLNVKNYNIAKQIEEILHRNMNPTTTKLVTGEVMIPSPIFNTLFIAFHAAQHYCSGLAIHHLCDWAIILKNYGLNIPQEIKDKKFLNFIAALTQLCNKYLGTCHSVEGGENLAQEMIKEILHPKFTEKIPTKNKMGIFVYKLRRLLHGHKLKNQILDSSLTKILWNSFISHLLKPSTIFKV